MLGGAVGGDHDVAVTGIELPDQAAVGGGGEIGDRRGVDPGSPELSTRVGDGLDPLLVQAV